MIKESRYTYGKIFERLFSPVALGIVDPGVYATFAAALRSRSEFDEVDISVGVSDIQLCRTNTK